MAEKKNQHLVPVCYLSSFIAEKSGLQSQNLEFEAGVYVNSKTLDSGWKMKGVKNKVFTKSYYYNLPEDDPNNPYIENYLASVESKYLKNLKKVEKREIDNKVLSFLSYFTMLQLIRVEKFIKETQDVWDQIAQWGNKVSGDNQLEEMLQNIVKKQIPVSDLGDIPHSNAYIIYNNTKFPFISSDNPVIRKRVNKEDLSMIIPNSLIDQKVKNSHESMLFLFPLTPSIAYISCDLLRSDKIIEFCDNNLVNIFYLNYWSILNAYNNVYSSIQEPIKGEAKLSHHLKMAKHGVYIKVYTENDRVILNGELVPSDENTLSITCETDNEFSKLQLGAKVSLVEVIENGCSIRGMRHCSVQGLDLNTGLIVIESDFKLP